MNHKQVKLENYNITVDEKMKNLITLVLDRGYQTYGQCQGDIDENPAYIAFYKINDGVKIFKILNASKGPQNKYSILGTKYISLYSIDGTCRLDFQQTAIDEITRILDIKLPQRKKPVNVW